MRILAGGSRLRRATAERHEGPITRRPNRDCRNELAEAERRLAEAQATLARRELDLKELRHRFANTLQSAASFLALQRRNARGDEARTAFAEASRRLDALARAHRIIDGRRAAVQVDVGELLLELGPELAAAAGLACAIEVEPVPLPGEAAMSLALLVSELAINASKHGYPGGEEGTLSIRCLASEGAIMVHVADDGIGLPPDFALEQPAGMGLKIVGALAGQLGARVNAHNDGGACFTLTLPLAGAVPGPHPI